MEIIEWYRKSEVTPFNNSILIVVTSLDNTYEVLFEYGTAETWHFQGSVNEENILFWRYKKTPKDIAPKPKVRVETFESKLNRL